MLCEIIDPSDPYTMECETFLIGAAAVCLLGGGQLGLHSEDESQQTPILSGWKDWFACQGVPDLAAFLTENNDAIADTLASVRIGRAKERWAEAVAVKHMTAPAAAEYRAEIHDLRRSSMNDLGRAAWKLAERLRERKMETSPKGEAG